MSKYLFSLVFLLMSVSLQAQNADSTRVMDSLKAAFNAYKLEIEAIQAEYKKKATEIPPSEIKWAEDNFDFGNIREGSEVAHRFVFTNTGKNHLIIANVKPSCGCTTPAWSQEAIKSGEKGFVEVKFNSAGREGFQKKKVIVTGNFVNEIEKVLYFTGEIIPNSF
jgi:Protein of unknown function (DUF1573)